MENDDILGDAYEHILMKFAPDKAKEGEIYTPREVVKLMVEILNPKPGESVYDPCCGSGGMLIIDLKHFTDDQILAQIEGIIDKSPAHQNATPA